MKRKALVIASLVAAFAVLVGFALWREFARDSEQLRTGISGLLDIDPALIRDGLGDIVRTDRAALILVDQETRQPVAIKFETPLVPPQNFRIGQEDSRDGKPLTGRYELIVISDKDGEVFRPAPGELYGRSGRVVALGDQNVTVKFTEPFHGTLFNDTEGGAGSAGPPAGGAAGPAGSGPAVGGPMMAEADGPPERTISGKVRAAPNLAGQVAAGDRMIVMLFDPEAGRPAAIRILPSVKLPQAFSISLPPGQPLKAGYSLRILTDKNNDPFGAASGELIGRSAGLVKPGTRNLDFVLDQPYTR